MYKGRDRAAHDVRLARDILINAYVLIDGAHPNLGSRSVVQHRQQAADLEIVKLAITALQRFYLDD